MNNFVFNIFKTIMFAMVFVFVFDMGFYLYRAMSFNQRMENIMTGMQKTVMENNYLTEGNQELYEAILRNLAADMNNNDVFVNGYWWNVTHDATDCLPEIKANKYNTVTGTVQNTNILRKCMGTPADYGDVMVVQVVAEIRQPVWEFTSDDATSANSSVNWQNDRTSPSIHNKTTEFSYTYYIPCLKYQAVTQ